MKGEKTMSDKFDEIINKLKTGEQPTVSAPTNQNQDGLTPLNEGMKISTYSKDPEGLTTRNNTNDDNK